MDRINVVLTIGELGNEEFTNHTCVVIQSILSNTKSDVNFCIAILKGEIVKPELFEKIKKISHGNCFLLEVDCPLDMDKIPCFRKFSKYSVTRLFLPNYLSGKWIYLDCADIVVNLDIKELWDESCDSIKGIRDIAMKSLHVKRNKYFNSFNVDFDNYYNSGVLLMDMDKLKDLPLNASDERFYDLPFWDQDILNCLYPSNDFLPEKFNFMPICHVGETYDDKKIFHYTAYTKSYLMNHGYGYPELYWKYRFEAFGDFTDCCDKMLQMSYYKNIANNLRVYELTYILKKSFKRLTYKLKNKDVNFSDVLKMLKKKKV